MSNDFILADTDQTKKLKEICLKISSSSAWASLVAQMIKNLPAMGETQVQSLDLEHPPEKEMATNSSILVWEIPWTEKGYCPSGYKEFDTAEQMHVQVHTHTHTQMYVHTHTLLHTQSKNSATYRSLFHIPL